MAIKKKAFSIRKYYFCVISLVFFPERIKIINLQVFFVNLVYILPMYIYFKMHIRCFIYLYTGWFRRIFKSRFLCFQVILYLQIKLVHKSFQLLHKWRATRTKLSELVVFLYYVLLLCLIFESLKLGHVRVTFLVLQNVKTHTGNVPVTQESNNNHIAC